jgi:hypothetical protein
VAFKHVAFYLGRQFVGLLDGESLQMMRLFVSWEYLPFVHAILFVYSISHFIHQILREIIETPPYRTMPCCLRVPG